MTITKAHGLALLPISLVAAIGCGGDAAEPPVGNGTSEITWHQDIAPIITAHCGSCHTEGGIAPFTLSSFEDAFPIAEFLANTVELGIMPPWSAFTEGDCAPRFDWKEDPRLSDDDMAKLRAWAEAGAPEGDPATAAPLPEPPSQTLSGVTHTLAPVTGYATSGDSDEMICFVLDPRITEVSWLTGMEVIPGDVEVVHHAVLMAVPPAARAQVEAQAGPDGVFDCFGGLGGAEGVYTLGVWVPGSLPFETPPDVGTPVAPGGLMVMQIHYHPAGVQHEPERTTTKLRMTTTQPSRSFIFTAVGNAPAAPSLLPGPNDRGQIEFRIPADVAAHTESMTFPIDTQDPRRFPAAAIFPHMHYIGTTLEARIRRANPAPGEPEEECLINVPRWDFDWQRTYFYDTDLDRLPTVGNGDVIDITCNYNNTLANPFVQRGLAEQGLTEPIDVFLGEESLDEMCLIGIGLIF